MKKLFVTLSMVLCGIAYSAEQKTYLTCESIVSQSTPSYGELEKKNFQFDLIITETKNYIEFNSSKGSIGGSVFFGTSPTYFPKILNIKNKSSSDSWDYEFNVAQPNGQIFSRNKFILNRFTGSLIVEYTAEDSGIFGKSQGYCKKAQSKLF
jgi:hypothetical protein